jgi:DNA-binding transcriptional ArsR family regulator
MIGILPTTSSGRRTPSLVELATETPTKLEARRPSEHAETALTPDSRDPSIVVFPSNGELSIRANGVPELTLRRHLARLVALGLIARRESPNGKRFARRGGEGETTAFGFDLAPFIASKDRIEAAAAEIRAHATRLRMLREKIRLLRRDCTGAIAALGDAGAEQMEEFVAELPRLSLAQPPCRARPQAHWPALDLSPASPHRPCANPRDRLGRHERKGPEDHATRRRRRTELMRDDRASAVPGLGSSVEQASFGIERSSSVQPSLRRAANLGVTPSSLSTLSSTRSSPKPVPTRSDPVVGAKPVERRHKVFRDPIPVRAVRRLQLRSP